MAGTMTSLVKWTEEKLSSLMIQASNSSSEVPSHASAEKELHKLQRTMMRIHAMLEDAEEKEVIDKSEQLRLMELKEVAYDAEDAVDEYEYEVLRAKMEARRWARDNHMNSIHDEVFDWNSYHPKVFISDDLTYRVREIREKIEEITNDWSYLSLREKEAKRRHIKEWKPIETTFCLDEAITFGREVEKEEVIQWLLQEDEPYEGTILVLPIVGMGGIGKTTLAQMAYNDTRVCKYFDMRGWVFVSEDFDVTSLTRKIVASLVMSKDNNTSLNEHYKTLKENLQGKKFLLILDDIWNQKSELWNSVKSFLTCAGNGKIIVTTRNDYVARIMQTTSPIYLSNLSFDNCWSLFMKIAFRDQYHNLQNSMLDIAKKIIEKCQGLPLAVKVLASILGFENDEETWSDILESKLWELDEEKDDILPALKLSYDRMPNEMKPCFRYLSLFRKSSLLDKPYIVKQWMSQGFLRPKGRKIEEDVGNAYFNELLQRSMLQYYDNMSTDAYIMHDLIYDLAQSIARDEHLLVTSSGQLHSMIPKTIRHVSLYETDNLKDANWRPLFALKHLRTLLLKDVHMPPLGELCDNLKCLRTLALLLRTRLPDSINSLKHLRYLEFHSIEFVPESMYNLCHLQTLDAFPESPIKLSRGIGDLINLRHLIGYDVNNLHHEVGGLTNLQTLEHFHVGAEGWQCKLRHLKDLVNLRGSLMVTGLETVRWSDRVTPADTYLKNKSEIEKLKLCWAHETTSQDEEDNNKLMVTGLETVRLSEHVTPADAYLKTKSETEKSKLCGGHETASQDEKDNDKLMEPIVLMDCLRPHSYLRRLVIEGYPGATLTAWFKDACSFSKLQELELIQCNCVSQLPTLGQLPILKRLLTGGMRRVRSIGRKLLFYSPNPVNGGEDAKRSSCCFPSLEMLRFLNMHGWEEWNGVEDGDLARLCKLDISSCPKLRRLPSLLPSLSELKFSREWNTQLLSSCCLPVLQSLKIELYMGTTLIFPDTKSLRTLNNLVIRWCFNLRTVSGLDNLASLRRLVIDRCNVLGFSPGEHLPPDLQDVDMHESPGAEKWYQDQVVGASYHQMEQETEAGGTRD